MTRKRIPAWAALLALVLALLVTGTLDAQAARPAGSPGWCSTHYPPPPRFYVGPPCKAGLRSSRAMRRYICPQAYRGAELPATRRNILRGVCVLNEVRP